METVTLKMDFGDLGQSEVEVTFKRIKGEPALYKHGRVDSPAFDDRGDIKWISSPAWLNANFAYEYNKTFRKSVDDALQDELDRQALEEAPE